MPHVRWTVDASSKELRQIRENLKEFLLLQTIQKKIAEAIIIAVNEACMNIIQHAYGADNKGIIDIDVSMNQQEIKLVLNDDANPVDLDSICGRSYEDIKPGGLGVAFIREIMDKVNYSHKPDGSGNTLTMIKKLGN